MSTARWGQNWADVDEDSDEDDQKVGSSKQGARFETPADEHGIKTVIEYTERGGKTYKVTKHVKQTTITKWTNKAMLDRKNLKKFGKAAGCDEASEKHMIVRSEEEVNIELSKKAVVTLSTKDDAEDKFLQESLAITEGLCKEKKVWTDMNRDRQTERDKDAAPATADAKPAESAAAAPDAKAPDAKPSAYVPPSLRGLQGKGGGKGGDLLQQQEASLRVTNLSEDVREGDLQDLFGQFGRLQRVFLAKDMTTFQSKGFAFVTYYNRADGEKAIQKLNGHGYDNLIIQVQWAKPRV